METQLSKDGSVHVTDEFYNTLISAIGAVLTVFGVADLLWRAHATGNTARLFSFLVYGLGVLGVFVTSALHHGVNGSARTNHILRQLDYCAIFVMIAGTFTPFCAVLVKGTLGFGALALVWSLAVVGIASKAFYPALPRRVMVAMTIGMGWLGLVLVKPVYAAIHLQGVLGLLIGGVFFTVGGLIFGLEKPNPLPGRFGFHEIWHCCVVAGAASHFALMYLYL